MRCSGTDQLTLGALGGLPSHPQEGGGKPPGGAFRQPFPAGENCAHSTCGVWGCHVSREGSAEVNAAHTDALGPQTETNGGG